MRLYKFLSFVSKSNFQKWTKNFKLAKVRLNSSYIARCVSPLHFRFLPENFPKYFGSGSDFLFSVWFKMNQFGKVQKMGKVWRGGYLPSLIYAFPSRHLDGGMPTLRESIAGLKLVGFLPVVTHQNHTDFLIGQGRFAKLVHFEPVSTSPVLSIITLGRIVSLSASVILCNSILGSCSRSLAVMNTS